MKENMKHVYGHYIYVYIFFVKMLCRIISVSFVMIKYAIKMLFTVIYMWYFLFLPAVQIEMLWALGRSRPRPRQSVSCLWRKGVNEVVRISLGSSRVLQRPVLEDEDHLQMRLLWVYQWEGQQRLMTTVIERKVKSLQIKRTTGVCEYKFVNLLYFGVERFKMS